MILGTNDNAGDPRLNEPEIDPGNLDAASLLASKKLSDGDADGASETVGHLKVSQTTKPAFCF